MTESEKALQPQGKRQVAGTAEQTRPGPTFVPAVDIYETSGELTLLADMPGVKAEDLTIDLNNNILTVAGTAESPEGPDEMDISREYRTGRYAREFTLSQVIDQSKIEARLKDGVLHLKLPKVEAATPRKIEVKSE